MSLFPVASWERIEDRDANRYLIAWGHYLRGCNRPYGKQSFGLFLRGELVSVAVSAFLVKRSIYGFERTRTIELARLCSHPEHREMTRVALRLWRESAVAEWPYNSADALLSYSRRDMHTGSIYRFDGWKHIATTRASRVGLKSKRSTGREIPAKDLWCFPPEAADRPEVQTAVASNALRSQDHDRTAA